MASQGLEPLGCNLKGEQSGEQKSVSDLGNASAKTLG